MGHDAKKSHLLAERSTTTASCDGEREEGMTRDPSLFEGDAAAGGACEDEGTAAEEATVTDAARGLSLRQLKVGLDGRTPCRKYHLFVCE